ncbi:MAG: C40 family peptidase [Blautia sp.]|nr:C40 family peptidase [Blautia sp.]
MRLSARSADVLSAPQVQGILLEVLWQNSFFTVLSESPDWAWLKIRTASQVEGYIPAWSVKERLDTDAYLTEADGDLSWFSAWAKVVKADQKSQEIPKSQEEKEGIKEQGIGEEKQKTEKENLEMSLREGIIKSARTYLGCAYRWGGKTPAGIDCSGLAFMSYLENGLFIYRDAKIIEGYPVHEISLENLKKADLLFFPGHVALYEGDGRYIHATAYRYTPCVTENSLNPADPLYREDLAGAITAVGSIWP